MWYWISIMLLNLCLINEQECFIRFKTQGRRPRVLDLIKHELQVYWTASKMRHLIHNNILKFWWKSSCVTDMRSYDTEQKCMSHNGATVVLAFTDVGRFLFEHPRQVAYSVCVLWTRLMKSRTQIFLMYLRSNKNRIPLRDNINGIWVQV